SDRDWSSDVCSSDLSGPQIVRCPRRRTPAWRSSPELCREATRGMRNQHRQASGSYSDPSKLSRNVSIRILACHGVQQFGFRDLAMLKLVDQFALREHEHAISQAKDFFGLARSQQDRHALGRELLAERINLQFGANINAACRI